jgi:hypothetical protein
VPGDPTPLTGGKVLFVYLYSLSKIANILPRWNGSASERASVLAIVRQWRWLVPDREMGSDANPHFPIFADSPDPPIKSAEPLIYLPPNDHCWSLDGLPHSDTFEPPRQHARAVLFRSRYREKWTVLIDEDVSTEGRANLWMAFERPAHRPVKAVSNSIIAMKQVHEMSPGALQTGVEVRDMTRISRLSIERHSPPPQLTHHSLWVILCRTVIHHLNLHLRGTGVLSQHGLKRLS